MDFREYNQILSLAPGENQTPLGLFQDYNSEFLAFPTTYCTVDKLGLRFRIEVSLHIIVLFVSGNCAM